MVVRWSKPIRERESLPPNDALCPSMPRPTAPPPSGGGLLLGRAAACHFTAPNRERIRVNSSPFVDPPVATVRLGPASATGVDLLTSHAWGFSPLDS